MVIEFNGFERLYKLVFKVLLFCIGMNILTINGTMIGNDKVNGIAVDSINYKLYLNVNNENILVFKENDKRFDRRYEDYCSCYVVVVGPGENVELKITDGSFDKLLLSLRGVIKGSDYYIKFEGDKASISLTGQDQQTKLYIDNHYILSIDYTKTGKSCVKQTLSMMVMFVIVTGLIFVVSSSAITIKESSELSQAIDQRGTFGVCLVMQMLFCASTLILLIMFFDVKKLIGLVIYIQCSIALFSTSKQLDALFSKVITKLINRLLFHSEHYFSIISSPESRISIKHSSKSLYSNSTPPIHLPHTLITISSSDIIILIQTIILLAVHLIKQTHLTNLILASSLVIFITPSFPEAKSYTSCYLFLLAFTGFDVFWVYLSPFVFGGKNGMVLAAQTLDFPIKLQLPSVLALAGIRCFTIGLGDVILPAIVMIYLKRYAFLKGDVWYYYTSLGFYFAALTVSGLCVCLFNYPQPAILFIWGVFSHLVVMYVLFIGWMKGGIKVGMMDVRCLFNPVLLETEVIDLYHKYDLAMEIPVWRFSEYRKGLKLNKGLGDTVGQSDVRNEVKVNVELNEQSDKSEIDIRN